MDGLKKYVGTKTIKAKPMTRGAYKDFRGLEFPKYENPDDDGYLVVLLNIEPNADKSEDYIYWWVNKKQFDNDFRPAETIQERLVIEYDELNQKFDALVAFLKTEQFESLSVDMKAEMQCQRDAMSDYLDCLSNRLELLSIGL